MKTIGWSLRIARVLAILAAALLGTASLPSLAFTLTITPVPVGGYATSSPGGLNCGTGGSTCTSSNITAFTTVTLTAHPNMGCTFVQWSVSGVGTSTTNPASFPMPSQDASGSATFQCAPQITSAAAATFQTNVAGSFNMTATGVPSPTFSVTSGSLPGGVSLASNGTLSGTPYGYTGGQYPVTITATNGVAPPATQAFTLTVNQPPSLDSGGLSFFFTVGEAHTASSPASGYPAPTVTLATGGLPTGITLSTDGTFSGTPAAGTAGTYTVTIKASNGIAPDATTPHTLYVLQAPGLIPTTSKNIEGLGQGFVGPAGAFPSLYAPSNTNIAVGLNHVVQVANVGMAVFDKSGTTIGGPYTIRNFWGGDPSPCSSNNDGLPLVQYDRAADRWVLVHTVLQPPATLYLCVAVSQTADPTGSYHRYPIPSAQGFNVPALAVWPDAYYLAFDSYSADYVTYQGARICALDRTRMLQGLSATPQCFTTSNAYRGLLPADLDGATPPPAGSPNYAMALGSDPNTLALWKFHVDWTTPANSTFTGPASIATDPFTSPCAATPNTCIPQAGTANKLDSRSGRLGYRLAYRNFGDHESIVASHAVVAGASTGVRWYEIRSPGGTPTVFQQGTQAPDAHHRWVGSAAMDWQGNLAMGYSVSSGTTKPQIRYAGRYAGDPAGQLSQGEASIVAGGGAQTSLNRWGDATSLRIDPSDDCTFWYTNQYLASDGAFNWRTRIASFKLPACIPATTTTLVSSPNPTVYGQNFMITATVAGHSPTGTVAFRMGSNVIATKTLVSGSASQSVFIQSVGTFPFTATYSGDAGNGTSVSPTLSHVVNKASATVTIVSHTPDPSPLLSAITVGVSVNVAAPGSGPVTGTVTVSDGVANCTITLPATSCSLTPISAGVKAITATYWGDSRVNPAIAGSVAHTVGKGSQTITFGTAPTLTVGGTGSVSATASSGLVVTYSTSSPACSVHATTGLVTGLSTGSCLIAADQPGNINYNPAPQATQALTVLPGGFVLSVSKSGAGTVVSNPAGIDCGATCSASFSAASSVTLTASASAGSFFNGWSGACTGTGACNVTMDAAKSVGAEFKLNTAIPRLANISTRGQVLTGNDVMIGGFIIGGSVPKTVVVRARGPSMVPFGVANAIANPRMDLYADQTIIASNDDWGTALNAPAVTASGFAPSNPLESAIHTTLAPGAYTAVVSGVNNVTGVGIVEVFEVDLPEIPLINISTRGQVLTNNDVMIGGFIIQGDSPQTVVIRARGPSLVPFGIPNALMDPVLQLFDGQTPIATNDNWQVQTIPGDVAAIQASGFAPTDAREAVIRVTLQPGAYTAIVTGKNGTTGVGIVEVFAQ